MTDTNASPFTRYSAAAVALVAAFALVLQYVVLIQRTLDTVGPAFATVRYFTFFTILSNLLAFLVTSNAVFATQSRLGQFLSRPVVRGGAALYIGVTIGIYVTILRYLWNPQGAQWWADSGLHYAVPTLYLAWWLWVAPHGALRWSDPLRWLMFPAVYVLWVFLRGAWVGEYPYPFLDLGVHDAATVLRNCVDIILLFVAGGVVLVLIDRWFGRVRRPAVAT